MKKAKTETTVRKSYKRYGVRHRENMEYVPLKNAKTVVHNLKLTAKMHDLAFTIFCSQKLRQGHTFTTQIPRMSDVIVSAKLAGVWPSTFLNKKLKIKLVPA